MDKPLGKKKSFLQAVCNKLKRIRIGRKIKKYKYSVQTVEGLVAFVCRDLSLDIIDRRKSPVNVVQGIFEYTKANVNKYPQRCRLLLFELLNIAASHKIQDRDLIRSVVQMLRDLSGRIDREIFLFDYVYNSHGSLPSDDEEFINKRDYILSQLAGWRIPRMVNENNINKSPYYLDKAVLSKGHRSQDIQRFILLEAIYVLQDSRFVLGLLQHGVYPVALYLYPMFTEINNFLNLLPSYHLRSNSYEMTIIKYFCRAKRHFVVHKLQNFMPKLSLEQITKLCLSQPLNIEKFENELFVAPSSMKFVPLDRYLYPACLKHLCRLRIRQSLLEADQLPSGLYNLPIPAILLDYLNLNQD